MVFWHQLGTKREEQSGTIVSFCIRKDEELPYRVLQAMTSEAGPFDHRLYENGGIVLQEEWRNHTTLGFLGGLAQVTLCFLLH